MWAEIAKISDQERYDLAAGLQLATESLMQTIIGYSLQCVGNQEINI